MRPRDLVLAGAERVGLTGLGAIENFTLIIDPCSGA